MTLQMGVWEKTQRAGCGNDREGCDNGHSEAKADMKNVRTTGLRLAMPTRISA